MSRRQPAWRSEALVTVCDGGLGDGGFGSAARGPLAGRDGGGAVMRVAAANRAAEAAAGIVPGLPLADARARLPDLRAVPAEGRADMQALAALGEWCGRWTPWVALDAAGPEAVLGASHGLWLDITGCAHLFGGEAALLEDMARRLARFGFAARAALADTPGAAWAMARFGGARHGDAKSVGGAKHVRVIAPGRTRAALAKLPLKGLRLAPVEAEGMERLGFRLIGDLYGIPRGALARRFGESVMRRLDQALGREDEPLSPRRPIIRHLVRQDFAEPIASREAIAAAARRLLEELAGVLEADARGARRLELTLYRGDGKVERIEVGTSAPVREPRHLMRLLGERLEALDAGFGFDSVTLAASVSEALAPAQLALDPQPSATPGAPGAAPDVTGQNLFEQDDCDGDVARLIDRLGARLGLGNVRRLALFPSHVPERAVSSAIAAATPPPSPTPPTAPSWHWPAGKQRPLRLLPRPEAIEAVAMLPEEPPVMFRWRRLVHRVVKADGPERIAAEWWHAEGAAPLGGAADSIRDYYRVEDDRGRRFWLYRDAPYRPGRTPGWWLHGVFA